jgi:SAM-dependent methyltransferase
MKQDNLSQALSVLLQNPHLQEEASFCLRSETIEYLEFHVLNNPSLPKSLLIEAHSLHEAIMETDQQLFHKLRDQLLLTNNIRQLAKDYIDFSDLGPGTEYDCLDLFINRLLAPTHENEEYVPEPTLEPDPDMVYFQKTPARVIFYLADWLQSEESAPGQFIDIGSGLGQAVILFHLLTGMPATGIEIEPAYVQYARSCSDKWGLDQVSFQVFDARQADFSKGSIFFLYTPFKGQMLQDVLDRLRMEATQKPITLFSYGPVTQKFQDQPWLRPVPLKGNFPDTLGIFKAPLPGTPPA